MTDWSDVYPSFQTRPHTLPALLKWRADGADAGAMAFVAADGRLSFRDWARRAAATAKRLLDRGLEPREPVGLRAGNADGCAWVIALVGIQWAGGIAVPISERAPIDIARSSVDRLGGRFLLTTESADVASFDVECVDLVAMTAASPDERQFPSVRCRPDDPAAFLHTSGTSGPPKAALFSHEMFALIGAATEDHLLGTPAGVARLTAGDVLQTSMPLSTTSGIMHLVTVSLFSGVRCVCEPVFDTTATIETMQREGTTIWVTVPAMMILLADASDPSPSGLSVRAVWHMGAMVTRGALAGMDRTLPAVPCLNLYGLTESGAGLIGSSARDFAACPGTLGRPLPTTEIQVVDAGGAPVANGDVGELWIRSPHMLLGYWKDNQIIPPQLAGGWIRTGDAVRVDDEGRVWLSGRLSDVIVRGGVNIHPLVVERAFREHDAVADVAVVGVDHRVLGQDLVAVVVKRRAVSDGELREHCRQLLADYQVPRRILEVESLPLNPAGKPHRVMIQQLVSRRPAEPQLDRRCRRAD
jgi:acyl-CoA synthetase (AMP-forming)/AMP-acid ligase II